MKLWHALSLLLIVLISAESLVGNEESADQLQRTGENVAAAIEAKSGEDTQLAKVQTPGPAKPAKRASGWAIDGDDGDARGDFVVADHVPARNASAAARRPSGGAAVLSVAGSRVSSPQPQLIESAL